MFKNLLALILAGVMAVSLCACGAKPQKENKNSPSESILQEEKQSETAPEKEYFEEQAVALTEIICETQISAENEFVFDAENADYRNFIIMLAAYKYPYEGVFSRDGNGIYHFPEDEIERVVYEVFGVENHKWEYGSGKGEGIAGFDYDAEKGEFTSWLDFGIGGGPSVKEPSVSSNGRIITVDFVLTDNEGYSGEPGWMEYGNFRTSFTVTEGENGSFLRFESMECIGFFEPLVIAEHIAALNEIKTETWFIESDSAKNYVPLYKDNTDEPYWDKTPDSMATANEVFNGNSENGMYNGYYYHGMVEECELITNFRNEQEIADYISEWIAPEVFDNENFRKHVMEYDGNIYRLWYSRGYGVSYYGDTVIEEQTETEITAVTKIYRIEKEEAGTAEIVFENRGGNWIIVSVEENYY